MNSKPVVHYIRSPENNIVLGDRACVRPLDHPNPEGYILSNTKFVSTSRVIAVHEDGGGFETLNTIYREEDLGETD